MTVCAFPSPRWHLPLICLGVLFLPGSARAHSPIQGAGDIVNGLLHPLTTITHVLIIVGLGLLGGRSKLVDFKLPMTIFAVLAGLALLLTTTGGIKAVYPPLLICIALCAAVPLTLELTPPPLARNALFATAALALGLDSAVESGSTATVFKTLVGNWISLIVLVADLAIYVSLAGEAKWMKIALRIVGSWIIAISLMMLAFSLRN